MRTQEAPTTTAPYYNDGETLSPWRESLNTVIFGSETPMGQLLASAIMIMGYGIIAVPTGIYSAELIRTYTAEKVRNDACPACGQNGHEFDADYCKHCGHALEN